MESSLATSSLLTSIIMSNTLGNITCNPNYISPLTAGNQLFRTPDGHSITRQCDKVFTYILSSRYFSRSFFTVFSTLSPTHSFTSFTFPLLTLFSCYRLAIRLMTLTNSYDLMTIPFILFLIFIHTLSFDEMRT